MKILLFFVLIFYAFNVFGQLPHEKPLYPNGIKENPVVHPFPEMHVDSLVNPKSISGLNRVYSYVSEPTYLIFPANREKNKNIGLVIFPGGGLRNIWLDKEGNDIALWFSARGITCMVVKYRTNSKDNNNKWIIDFGAYLNAIRQDAVTSVQIMKEVADSMNFDKNKIGVMGFSAGGLLPEQLVYTDLNAECEWNTDFVALIYYGNNVRFFKESKNREKLPPFFMAIAENDKRLPYEGVLPYLKMISSEVNNSELHIYPDGGHGFGLAYDETMAVSKWKFEFLEWLYRLYK